MLKNYKFWFKAGSWALLVTGLLHSLSLLNKPVGETDTERQMLDLFTTVMLQGIDRTMYDLYFFFSLSMTMFSVFTAIMNLLFARFYMPSANERVWLLGNVVFWTAFIVPLMMYTFIIPVICYAVC